MKMKWHFFGLLLFVLSLSVYRLRASTVQQPNQNVSPLAVTNTVIPEILGTSKVKSNLNLSPEELAKLESAKKFKSYLERSYLQLPSIESLRLTKTGDFHMVSTEVIQSSEIFGEISETLSSNPSLTPEALKFFSACTTNELLVTSVRAVCARNLKDWARRSSIDISKINIPENIARVADFLPKMN